MKQQNFDDLAIKFCDKYAAILNSEVANCVKMVAPYLIKKRNELNQNRLSESISNVNTTGLDVLPESKPKKIIRTEFSIGNTRFKYIFIEGEDMYQTAHKYCIANWDESIKKAVEANGFGNHITSTNCAEIVMESTESNIIAILDSLIQ